MLVEITSKVSKYFGYFCWNNSLEEDFSKIVQSGHTESFTLDDKSYILISNFFFFEIWSRSWITYLRRRRRRRLVKLVWISFEEDIVLRRARRRPFIIFFSNFNSLSAEKWERWRLVVGRDRGGGQVVSVLAFYSDDSSSNPAGANNYSIKLLLKWSKINEKRPGLAHF